MSTSTSPFLRTVLGTAIATVLAAPALAQVFEEEIIVTAQKKAQNMQDVGVSMSAFTGQQMETLGWDNSLDAAKQTPGLIATSNTGDTGNIALFSIRGVSQLDFAEGQEAPIAQYRDQAYVSSPGASGVPTYDIERIEVLRGPQGTLYGRNATGGLVHYISNKPTESFEGNFTATAADFGQLGLTGALSGPLSDAVQGRVAVYYNKDDGYIKNHTGDDMRADDTSSVRGLLNFDIGEDSSLLLIGQYTTMDTRGGVYHSRASKIGADGLGQFCVVNDPDGCGVYRGDQPVGNQDFFGFYGDAGSLFDNAVAIDDGDGSVWEGSFDYDRAGVERDSGSLTATFESQLTEAVRLVSVTDYSQSDKKYYEEDDSTGASQYASDPFGYGLVIYDATADITQFSEELRLNGTAGDLQWIAGVYYLKIDDDFSGAFMFPSDQYWPKFEAESETETYSAFGQIDYSISDSLLLTAGLRWTEDTKDLSYQMVPYAPGLEAINFYGTYEGILTNAWGLDPATAALPGIPLDTPSLENGDKHDFSREDGEWSGKLQLEYSFSDHMVYAGVSRGTKGGGFNTPSDGLDAAHEEAVGFDPEILTAYEIGLKTEWLDGDLRLNGSIYYYDYENFQAFYFAGTTSLMINSEAEFYGGELEMVWSPGEGWDVLAGVSTVDTSVDVPARPASPAVEDQKAPLSSDFSWNTMVRKQWTFDGGATLAAQVAANHVDDQYFNIINAETTRGGDYTLVDASMSYAPGDTWEFTVFVNNLTDEEALTYSYDISAYGKYTIQVFGPPRWAGAKLKMNF
jgi:iron complex outermembrane receptor protein